MVFKIREKEMLKSCSQVIRRRIAFPKSQHTLQLRYSSSDAVKQERSPTIQTLSLGSLAVNSSKVTESRPNEHENTKVKGLPPSLKAVRDMMDQYKDYVVITQLGSFYELYFEHAVEFSAKLNLTLAKKQTKNFTVPMAGFPLQHLSRHLKVLVQDLNMGVAIVEQFREADQIDNEQPRFQRRLTRIISPGTLIDEAFLNSQENNYLLSVVFEENGFKRAALTDAKVGLAWTDLSVGSVFVQETHLKDLISTITRIKPSEIVLDEKLAHLKLESGDWYPELVELKRYFIRYQSLSTKHQSLEFFYDLFNADRIQTGTSMRALTLKESRALRPLLQYISNHLPEASTLNLQLPKRQVPTEIMQIDSRTSEALELHKRVKDDSRVGALLSCIKRTLTTSGARLLSQWISAPSTNLKEIKRRQEFVNLFFKNTAFRTDVQSKLNEVHDIGRIVQRFALGKGTVLDLVNVSRTISIANELRDIMRRQAERSKANAKILQPFLKDYHELRDLATTISNTLDEESLMKVLKTEQEQLEQDTSLESALPVSGSEGAKDKELFSYVRPDSSQRLSKLHCTYNELMDEKASLIRLLREKVVDALNYAAVELKIHPTAGYRVQLKSRKGSKHDELQNVLPGATFDVVRSSSSKWVNYPKWTSLGAKIDITKQNISTEEEAFIKKLKEKVIKQSIPLRDITDNLDWLDVTSSFAVLAHENNLVCPQVDKSLSLEIINGRHLVVEEGLKRNMNNFTPNNYITEENKSLWVISGPNMGGKSTFLRQNAIIVIMAQIGCYVPADRARIGVVDKIFSRVGAADDLYNNMSTFMVEMIETSYILKGATERSLAILDEVGRGTSGKEGLAIAFATLRYMLKENKCRALFATHFGQELHELLAEENELDGTVFKRTKITSVNNKPVYDHNLVEGVSNKSYAINVASLAGFPQAALETAEKTLAKL